jgi:hypothetical protein
LSLWDSWISKCFMAKYDYIHFIGYLYRKTLEAFT